MVLKVRFCRFYSPQLVKNTALGPHPHLLTQKHGGAYRSSSMVIVVFKSSPKDVFIDFRERERETLMREKYQLVASPMLPNQGSNLKPRYMP